MRTKHILEELKNIREIATMERSFFTKPGSGPFSEESDQFTLDVREGTRLWRDSWIIGPLDEIIEMLEKELAK